MFLALRSIGYPAGMAEGSVSLEVRTPALTLMHLLPKGRSPYESLLCSCRASWRQAFGILEHQTRSRECPHSKVIEFAPLGAQLPQLAPAGNCVDVLWFRSKRLCSRNLKHRYLWTFISGSSVYRSPRHCDCEHWKPKLYFPTPMPNLDTHLNFRSLRCQVGDAFGF